jgi:hypothetical protein
MNNQERLKTHRENAMEENMPENGISTKDLRLF